MPRESVKRKLGSHLQRIAERMKKVDWLIWLAEADSLF
jgi:hypothetical protein